MNLHRYNLQLPWCNEILPTSLVVSSMAPSCQRPFPACIQNFRGRTLWHYPSPLSISTWRVALSPARERKKKERRNKLKWYLLQKFERKENKICFLEKWNPIKFTRVKICRKSQNGSRMKMKLENIETD